MKQTKRFDRATLRVRRADSWPRSGTLCAISKPCRALKTWICQFATDRELSLKQRNRGMEVVKQFLIREPDQVVEANGNERLGIVELQLKLGAVAGVLKAVEHIAEGAGVVKQPGSLFEVVFAYGLPDLQAARSDNLF